MKKKLSIVIFILSFASLFISLKLFWNMGIFVDAYNLTPSVVNGGNFWLLMDWLRLLLLFLICSLSLIGLLKDTKNK